MRAIVDTHVQASSSELRHCRTAEFNWQQVTEYAAKLRHSKLAPHDLRRYAESRIMPNARTLTTIYKVAAVNDSA